MCLSKMAGFAGLGLGLLSLLALPAASTTRWVKPRDARAAHPTDLFLADGTAEAPRTNSCQTTFIPIANRTGGE